MRSWWTRRLLLHVTGKDGKGRKEEKKEEIAKDTEGKVLEFNTEGSAKIAFRDPVSAEGWLLSDQFYRLFPFPNASDPELRAGMSVVVTIDTGHVRHVSDLLPR